MPVCQLCKIREADTTLIEYVDGTIKKGVLCSICAEREADGIRNIIITFQEVKKTEKRCSSCGMTLYEFRKRFLLGCPSCYESFREDISEILEKVVGKTRFEGRRPRKEEKILPLLKQRELLLSQLEEAINQEEFEKAAKLRDEIKKLDEQLQWFRKS